MAPQFFGPALAGIGSRITHTATPAHYLLDKNEQTENPDSEYIEMALNSLREANWNRYPTACYASIEEKVASYCGLSAENIVLGPGSASIIASLLNYFAINHKRVIINQPSYSLFGYHCNTYNIPFEPWLLNEDLQFDLFSMPVPDANSVVIITSPNNPTGNTVSIETVEFLLERYPQTLFIVDAVYCEFGKQDFTPLVLRYNNLAVIRSFSKAFPIAGLRLGYLCAAPCIAQPVKKLMLPFAITEFTLAFAQKVLFLPCFMQQARQKVKSIIAERERMYSFIKMYFSHDTVKAYASQGNFLLLHMGSDELFSRLMDSLESAGIRVLNTSSNLLLHNTIRVTIGQKQENDAFTECLVQALSGITAFKDRVALAMPLAV